MPCLEAPLSDQSSSGDLHRARTKVPRASYTGDNFANMSSVLNKSLLREVPNCRSCDEFSVEELQRPQKLNAVYNCTADVRHVPRELEVMARRVGVTEWRLLAIPSWPVRIATNTVTRQ